MRQYVFYSLALCLTLAAPAAGQVSLYGQPSTVPSEGTYQASAPPVAREQTASAPALVPALAPAPAPVAVQPVAEEGQSEGCLDGCGYACDRWFGSVAGLVMTRDNANAFWTTYETNNNPNQLLNTRDADSDWAAGFEVRLGRWFDCGPLGSRCGDSRNGLQVVYFYVGQLEGFASVRGDSVPAGTVSTTIDLQDPTTVSGNVEINGQDTAIFFDGATEHRIWRTNEFQNIEVNFVRQRLNEGEALQVTWLGGIRYFRFDERLIFGSVQDGFEFGDNGGANEAYLNIRSENNLIGTQIGARLDYQTSSSLGLFAEPKFGVYGNQVETQARLYRGDGVSGFDISGSATDFSILAQFDAGLNYQMTQRLRAFIGYRVIAVTNVALSDNQIPHFLAAADELAAPQTNGSLILHGGMGGLEFRF